MSERRKTEVFIVRIWHEEVDREDDRPHWRCEAEHVGSGEAKYFEQLPDLMRFIESKVGLSGKGRSSP